MAKQVTKSIIVKGTVNEVFQVWADFENFSNFMKPVKAVSKINGRKSHWVVEGPLGKTIEWDAETTTFEPNQRIAWNSNDGDIKTTGQVTFTSLPENQTQVTVTLQYVPPAGLASSIADKLFGDPEGQLQENLRGFKSYVEKSHLMEREEPVSSQ